MQREILNPATKADWLALRTKDLTSTDIAALFGCSPYLSAFELWHRKKMGDVAEFQMNPRVMWGQRLERTISEGIAEDYGFKIRHMTEYIRIPALRLGSSFDNAIDEDGLLEVKNVDGLAYKDGWIADDASFEAPPHIELQVQHQLLVSGRAYANIGALIGGNRAILIKRFPDKEIHDAIKTKAVAFWHSIDNNEEPAPDFKQDAKFISHLNSYSEPGKVIGAEELDPRINDLALKYKHLAAEESTAKESKEAVKAEILTLIGDAEKVYSDKFSISAKVIPPALIEAYTRKPYRDFRVNLKKHKEVIL